MTYDEAKNLLAETSDIGLRAAVLALTKEVEYLRGFTETLKERLDAAESKLAFQHGASIAFRDELGKRKQK